MQNLIYKLLIFFDSMRNIIDVSYFYTVKHCIKNRKENAIMDNQNNNFDNNKLDGFDSATPATPDTENTANENNTNNAQPNTDQNNAYTFTPDGAYYETIQAQPAPTQSEPTAPTANNTQTEPQKSSFIPSGDYPVDGAYHFAYKKAEPAPVQPQPATQPIKKEKKHRRFPFGAIIATALIASILGSGLMYIFLSANSQPQTAHNASYKDDDRKNDTTTTEKVVEISGSIEELAEVAANKAGSSVVGIQTTFAIQSFFSGNSTSSGSGSGVIYKEDGYIITNYHVIADALDSSNSSITVYLDNNTEKGYKASVINYNISCDLAVLKIDKTGLNAIDIADSDQLKVGQYVVAIGSPAGLEFMGSTTFGIISGLNRQISTTNGTMNLIQTDAAINPGNSGGALVNAKGELVGISSSKLVNESYEGMGFAIPVNTVVKICDNLIAHEGEGDPYTGISLSYNYTEEILKYYGYPAGAVVSSVDAGSPAENAGIQRGDIITKYGDTTVSSYNDYESALKEHFPGETVKVEFYRSGKTRTVSVTVGSVN